MNRCVYFIKLLFPKKNKLSQLHLRHSCIEYYITGKQMLGQYWNGGLVDRIPPVAILG